MKKLLKHMWLSFLLFRMGYFLSDNTHKDWGFLRLNFNRGVEWQYSILDIDFQVDQYSHVHGGRDGKNETLFRWDRQVDF